MTTVAWLGTQGVGETNGCFAAIVEALVRRRGLAGDEQERREKTEQRREGRRRRLGIYRVAKEARGSHDGAFSRASMTPEMATTRLERRRRSPAM